MASMLRTAPDELTAQDSAQPAAAGNRSLRPESHAPPGLEPTDAAWDAEDANDSDVSELRPRSPGDPGDAPQGSVTSDSAAASGPVAPATQAGPDDASATVVPGASSHASPEAPVAPEPTKPSQPVSDTQQPGFGVSKVQLVAEAFRQRGGARATPSIIPSTPASSPAPLAGMPNATSRPMTPAQAAVAPSGASSSTSSTTESLGVTTLPIGETIEPEPEAAVLISPVVVVGVPVEASDATVEVTGKPSDVPVVMPAMRERQVTPVMFSPIGSLQHDSGSTSSDPDKSTDADVPTSAPRGDREPTSSGAVGLDGSPPSSKGMLALDSEVSLQFFSQMPPASNPASGLDFEPDIEPEMDRRMVRVRTPEQIARQLYLRRLVLRLMLIVGLFVMAVVAYVLRQRGHHLFTR